MRSIFKSYKDKQIKNAANLNGSAAVIENTIKQAELLALNNTLDDIVLEISVQK